MSDSTVNALMILIPILFGSLATSIAQIIIAVRSSSKQDVMIKQNNILDQKQDNAAEKITKIQTATDGTLSELKKDLAEAKQEILGLKALVVEKDRPKDAILIKEVKEVQKIKEDNEPKNIRDYNKGS